MKIFFYFSCLFIFIYISMCVYLYFMQENKIFNKKRTKPYKPQIAKTIYFKTSDGIILSGASVKNKKNALLILYFSGNTSNTIEFLDKTAPKIKNFNFLGFNYPGYADSTGKPCEKCIEKYALEIYDKYNPDIIMGRSLGSAVASYVAGKRDVKKVLLITPFSSIECIAKMKYPFFPVKLFLKYPFYENKFISHTSAPVSIIALKNDDKIPQKCLNILIKNIKNLKNIYYLDKIKHGNIYNYPHIEKIIEKVF